MPIRLPSSKEAKPLHSPRVVTLARDAALHFLNADTDGSRSLSWEEFECAVPKELKEECSPAQLRAIFDSADADGDGDLTMDEFFLWTLGVASQANGRSGLEAIFHKYGTGKALLDGFAMARAVEDLGFGSFAHDLFVQLDHDESGTVSYEEMLSALQERVGTVTRANKRFLTAIAFRQQGGSSLDTSGWKLSGDAETVRKQLSTYLLTNAMGIKELHQVVTHAGLSRSGFPLAMKRLGYCGSAQVLEDIFGELDLDRSGVSALFLFEATLGGTPRGLGSRPPLPLFCRR